MEIANDTTDPVHDLEIAQGKCYDSTLSTIMDLQSALIKQIDNVWSDAGAAPNGGFPSGLSAGSPVNATWYRVFVIVKDDGTVDGGFDTAADASNLLADATDYTEYREVGRIRYVDGTIGIKPFLQYGDFIQWQSPNEDLALTAVTVTTKEDHTVLCPPDMVAKINYSVSEKGGSGAGSWYVRVTNPNIADVATVSTNATSRFDTLNATGNIALVMDAIVDSSSQISTRWDNVPGTKFSHEIRTLGFTNNRKL
jgi:hypothetical protein